MSRAIVSVYTFKVNVHVTSFLSPVAAQIKDRAPETNLSTEEETGAPTK